MTTRAMQMLLMVVSLLLLARVAAGQEAKTVIGPHNAELSAGAEALLAGDAERGVRLTLEGLRHPTGLRDRRTGFSNQTAVGRTPSREPLGLPGTVPQRAARQTGIPANPPGHV